MSDATLIQCTATKRDREAPARMLYDESAYFRKMRAWAESRDGRWYILSAKHGLVSPDEPLAPYDERGLSQEQAEEIAFQLDERAIGRVYVCAGRDYLDELTPALESVYIDVVQEFMRLHEKHPCDATPMVPLQPPHDQHYQDLKGYSHYVLGGMSVPEYSYRDRVRFVLDFARVAEGDPYVHALGVGGGRKFTEKIAPLGVLDSIDCATPGMAAKSGKVLQEDLLQRHVTIHQGDGARRRNVPLAEFNSWQIQDAWDKHREEQSEIDQSGLNDYV